MTAPTTSVDLTPADQGQLEVEAGQVRTRDRVRDLAEVFTHQREVDAMLDQMPDAFTEVDTRFLEPTFMCKWDVSRDIPEAA